MDDSIIRFWLVAVGVVIMGGGIPAVIILADRFSKSLASRMGGRQAFADGEATAALEKELAASRDRLESAERRLADSERRLVELEERVDFAERLLSSRPHEPGRLPPRAS